MRSCLGLQVHLLNDERGAVIETLIARTQRTVCPLLGACCLRAVHVLMSSTHGVWHIVPHHLALQYGG